MELHGISNASVVLNGGSLPSEGGWWAIAKDVYSVVKWLFEAFRDNFIVCYLSSDISKTDQVVPEILNRWFKATEIPFSSRMNPDALIEGLKNIEEIKGGTLATLIAAFDQTLSGEMSPEDFVNNHVMTLSQEKTIKIRNLTDNFAFWLSTEDLKKDFLTLEKEILKELKKGMGVDPDLEIDLFVEHCRDKMEQLKAQLERLVPSESE